MTSADPTLHPAISRIQCPRCGNIMRLARIEPTFDARQSATTFDCSCGFTYQQSERARTSSHEKNPPPRTNQRWGK